MRARLSEDPMEPSTRKSRSLWDTQIIKRALWDSFVKLNPRTLMKNPHMFVVEVGGALLTVQIVRHQLRHMPGFAFGFQITVWLWFTVVFANFAEAMAEGRGKAQAETLRKSRTQTTAKRLRNPQDRSTIESVHGGELRKGDVVLCMPGDM